ncbi:zinc ribbon domain-containing protein [Stratiformator vulcanicus]|uniref:Zinc-ribbon domain-containing protein n=1 Tax=Stratiformator vulcanicus TaxID=2527980 RepID=A0A517QX56_9PLAN|nr:zinc ribbon domain-containing protein [Stratiformator vulcanicus]QDT36158.1 hypothetical protein Pan189_05130 [Stratiformator vulcanicus]
MSVNQLEDSDWDADPDDFGEYDEGADEPTIECPHCGAEVYEDSPRCPRCEQYLSREDAPSEPKPTWIIVGALAALLGIVWWLIG